MKKYSTRGLNLALVLVTCVSLTASAQMNEVIYLADTLKDSDGLSALYKVDINNGSANLTLLPNAILPYEHVDVLCAETDGSVLWYIDDRGTLTGTGMLGWYDVASATVGAVGVVSFNGQRLQHINQAAIAPDGTLYITSDGTDSLYTLDRATAVATLVGPIVTPAGARVNLPGSDIAFAADGTLYIWVNGPVLNGVAEGLYVLALPAGGTGQVIAHAVGSAPPSGTRFTGLALRANGLGDVVGSANAGPHPSSIVVVDKVTGQLTESYPFMEKGVPFAHVWGDMSVGPLALEPASPVFCTYTIGYWKNHAWDGRTVSILGVTVDEALGKQILKGASSKNMSMLFAQLIAAKLNVNNASGIEVIDGAEDYLAVLDGATADIVINAAGGQTLNWKRPHSSGTEKSLTAYWSGLLDEFNNVYHCAD